MRSATELVNDSIPSSPSLSLANFDYDSDGLAELAAGHSPPPPPPVTLRNREADVSSPFMSAHTYEDRANKSDIVELRAMIQQEFTILKSQLPTATSPAPVQAPTVSVPETAFTDALRAELALQMAKVSVLEEEVRKLRGEKQALHTKLERVENAQPLCAELDAANAEKQRLYVERQGLWEERADLWKYEERQSLWDERGELWKERGALWEERGELWVVRDKLMEQ
ncbi:hypothetical protein FRC07_004153, partial [Ceratobasidium sp. 392]